MKHADVRQKLSAYLDGEVSEKERLLIEEHLASCPACDAALKELEKTIGHVRNLEEIEPPPWMARKIMTRVREEAGRKRSIFSRLFLPLHIKLPVEAMALVLVTVTAYIVYRTAEPQMRLEETPRTEEYRKALPESAPAPSTAPRGKDRASRKTETETVPAPPSERKPARTTDESRPAPPTPEPETAIPRPAAPPLPAAKKQEYEDKAEKSPLPAGARKAERHPLAAAPAADERSGLKAKSAERQLELSTKGGRPAVSLKLTAIEIDSAAGKIDEEIARLGGKITKTESSGTSRTLTAVIDARELPALHERLKLIGDVKGAETLSHVAEEAGEVTAVIELVRQAGK